MQRWDWRTVSGLPLEEPLGLARVGSRQGPQAGLFDEDEVLDEEPPRLAGYEAHLEPPPLVELEEQPPEDAAIERTGEQLYLPPGRGPGERGGTALMGPRDYAQGPRLVAPGEAPLETGG